MLLPFGFMMVAGEMGFSGAACALPLPLPLAAEEERGAAGPVANLRIGLEDGNEPADDDFDWRGGIWRPCERGEQRARAERQWRGRAAGKLSGTCARGDDRRRLTALRGKRARVRTETRGRVTDACRQGLDPVHRVRERAFR